MEPLKLLCLGPKADNNSKSAGSIWTKLALLWWFCSRQWSSFSSSWTRFLSELSRIRQWQLLRVSMLFIHSQACFVWYNLTPQSAFCKLLATQQSPRRVNLRPQFCTSSGVGSSFCTSIWELLEQPSLSISPTAPTLSSKKSTYAWSPKILNSTTKEQAFSARRLSRAKAGVLSSN